MGCREGGGEIELADELLKPRGLEELQVHEPLDRGQRRRKLARFARSPQGRQMADKAKRFASDPKNKQKIEGYRKKFANRSR